MPSCQPIFFRLDEKYMIKILDFMCIIYIIYIYYIEKYLEVVRHILDKWKPEFTYDQVYV